MKSLLSILILIIFVVLGCKFGGGAGDGPDQNQSINSKPEVSVTSPQANASNKEALNSDTKTKKRDADKKDFVGRWVKTIMGYKNVIELNEDGTGTLIINEGIKDEARDNFTWKVEFNDAVFTLEKPVVNEKFIDSGKLSVRADLSEDGKKLQTDYSAMYRSKGDDIYEQK